MVIINIRPANQNIKEKVMKILVVNCGSSSLKFQLIETESEKVMAKGLCERIGSDKGHFVYNPADGQKSERDVALPTHDEAVKVIVDTLTDPSEGVIKSLAEIDAVGHRFVHGGDKFTKPTVLNEKNLKELEELNNLAPLHNPVCLMGIRACQKGMPDTKMVAVFDTAFHSTLPEEAYLFGIPYKYYEKYKIRRYGFHGMSHEYVAIETAKELGKAKEDCKIITCHIGNGASVTAVKNGKSVDTSMGYTPLDGLIMGTRCGSLDPEVVHAMAQAENKSYDEIFEILNKKSGVYGLSDDFSSDIRDLTDEYFKGNEKAVRALNAYTYRIAKYVGAYAVAMDGVDAITFTAGVGEHSYLIRKLVSERLHVIGADVDDELNKNADGVAVISKPDSKVKVYVIPTDEEMSIARQTASVL